MWNNWIILFKKIKVQKLILIFYGLFHFSGVKNFIFFDNFSFLQILEIKNSEDVRLQVGLGGVRRHQSCGQFWNLEDLKIHFRSLKYLSQTLNKSFLS